jgi:hypothetical protein
MLYDGRGDYIRRREPKRVPFTEIWIAVWLAVLLVSVAQLYGSIKQGQPADMNESFKQLFSWG